nr:MAG TPA: hypothetical protein [Caudoviricetes sp.]
MIKYYIQKLGTRIIAQYRLQKTKKEMIKSKKEI